MHFLVKFMKISDNVETSLKCVKDTSNTRGIAEEMHSSE